MRLSKKEVAIIKQTILKYIKNSTIILFGSRIDDTKKGGDIDLLIQTDKIITLKDKIKILTLLELNGILRRVDLIIQTPKTKKSSIIEVALKEGIKL